MIEVMFSSMGRKPSQKQIKETKRQMHRFMYRIVFFLENKKKSRQIKKIMIRCIHKEKTTLK